MNIDTDPRYAWWRDALAGARPEAILTEPQSGFYYAGKGEGREPVAIFSDGVELLAITGFDRNPVEVGAVWPRCYSHPISVEVYWDTVDNRRWADLEGIVEPVDPAAVPFGNRPPADPFEEIAEEAESAIGALEAILPGEPLRDQALADRLANSKDRLRELWRKAEGERKAEKKPHDDAAAAVQMKWNPLQARIADAGQRAEIVVNGYLKWARDEQERKRREELEAAAEAERQRVASLAALKPEEEAPPELLVPVEAPPPAEPVRAGGGLTGRRTGLRKNWRAVVDDYPALIEHLKDNEQIREAAFTIANAAARSQAHTALPGCRAVYDEGTT